MATSKFDATKSEPSIVGRQELTKRPYKVLFLATTLLSLPLVGIDTGEYQEGAWYHIINPMLSDN